MKARVLAVAVFRSVASCSSSSGRPRDVSDVVAEVSLNSADGGLVDRKRLDDAVTLLVRSKLIEPQGDSLRLAPEGDEFWQRISHLPPSAMKKWIREAVDAYSRGEELQWASSDKAWSDAHALFLERDRSRMVARLEVLDGLLRALENWHFVSTLIGASADRSAALAALQGSPYLFSKIQAHEIVDMRIVQRTALGRLSLAEERDAIRAELEGPSTEEPQMGLECLPKADVAGLEHIRQDLDSLAERGSALHR